MSLIIDGTNGLTFNNATTQASAGSVIQVVSVSNSTASTTTSTTYVATALTATITPKFSTSKILVSFNSILASTSTNVAFATIYKSSTNLAGGTAGFTETGNTGAYSQNASGQYLDSPLTTSATTYAVYIRVTGGTGYWLDGTNVVGTITLMEIAA